jgi:hypothetical protein
MLKLENHREKIIIEKKNKNKEYRRVYVVIFMCGYLLLFSSDLSYLYTSITTRFNSFTVKNLCWYLH